MIMVTYPVITASAIMPARIDHGDCKMRQTSLSSAIRRRFFSSWWGSTPIAATGAKNLGIHLLTVLITELETFDDDSSSTYPRRHARHSEVPVSKGQA